MRRYSFGAGTAIVTGAASGIGAALSDRRAARGAPLVVVDRDRDRLDEVLAEFAGGASRSRDGRTPRLLIGASAKIPDALARIAPGHFTRLLTV